MSQKSKAHLKLALAGTALGALACLLWAATSDETSAITPAAVVLEITLLIASLLLLLRLRSNKRVVSYCELCSKERGGMTDHMAWAHRNGLDACNDCSFKMQVAFGNIESSGEERILH